MWWLIFLYIIPGMVTTYFLPKMIEYNGGQEFLKLSIDNYDESYYNFLIGVCSFCPILNLVFTILLIWWLCTTKF